VSKLFVFYRDKKVGTLTKKADDTLSFSYSSDWLNDTANNFWLSPVLKLESKAFNHRETRSFFENLLPEGDIRKKLEKTYSKSLTDDYTFLEQFGVDCAGAFIIIPDESFISNVDAAEVEEIDIQSLCQAAKSGENLAIHTLTKYKAKFSLAGAQDKIPVIYGSGRLYVPTKGGATSHILKPPAHMLGVDHTVENEYFCMVLAAEIGLDVPGVTIINSDIPLYVVERYDRVYTESGYERVHQFDFCQAQGVPSSEKYEEDGGPNIKTNYNTLLEYSENPPNDIDKLIDWVCFNLIIGNNDSHSKNISFLKTSTGYSVSPYYDLLSTVIYEKFDSLFAFKIGGQRRWQDLRRANFEMLSKELGFSKDIQYVSKRFITMSKKILTKIDGVKKNYDSLYSEESIVTKIVEEVKKRIRVIGQKLPNSSGKI